MSFQILLDRDKKQFLLNIDRLNGIEALGMDNAVNY